MPEEPKCRDAYRWEFMMPHQFEEAQNSLPVAFLPIGVVEWHGYHNVLGVDAVKAHALCLDAALAAGGGVVHPPHYGGVGGLDYPATLVIEPEVGEVAWGVHLLRIWLERTLSELHRQGFRAIILLTGHYGHNQQITVRETAVRMAERLQIPILGTAEYWLALDEGYLGDHAGVGETSLMLHLYPGFADMTRFKADMGYGLHDDVAPLCSADLGRRYAEAISGRMAKLAKSMLQWDAATLAAFIGAERAIVSAQVRAWRETGNGWKAWQGMVDSGMTEYGRLLVEGDFAAIAAAASRLY